MRFFHNYYDAFSAKDFKISPSPDTIQILRGYGILFKSTPVGFVLLYNSEKEKLLEKLKGEIFFTFGLNISNKYFNTFSDMESTSEYKKYLFTNALLIDDETDGEEKKKIKIHSDSFVNKKDVCLCSYNSLVLRDLLGNDKVIVEQNEELIFEGELGNGQNAKSVLTNGFGRYTVSIKDSQKINLLHLPESFLRDFAVIEIAIGGESSFQDVKDSEYQIYFDSRDIQWNYYFVADSKTVYDSIEVYSGREKLSFSDSELTTLINGQQAHKVASKALFPLQQKYEVKNFHAELKTSDGSGSKSKKVNLITPDITRIKGKQEKESEIYFSDMYVYL